MSASASAEIYLDQPVARANFYYASASAVVLEAFDEYDTLLVTAVGPANLTPTNGFSVWEELGVDAGSDLITTLRVSGTSGGTGIDDFKVCLESAQLIEAEIDLHPNSYPNDTDPYNTSSKRVVDLGVLSTAELDATTIDIATAALGDPTLGGYVAAVGLHSDDIDRDGLLDLVIDFGEASGFADAGALNAASTEVLFTARTLAGDFVHGTDSVVIAGK